MLLGPIDVRYPVLLDPIAPGVQPPSRLTWVKAHGKMSPSLHLMFHQVVPHGVLHFHVCITDRVVDS